MSGPIQLERVRATLARAKPQELERPRRAAVALVLTRGSDGALSVLLLRRTEREGDPWSGHMALPGGKEQPEDADLLHTARRETLEEVGIDLGDAEFLGQLDDLSPMRSSEMVVRPFVFWIETARETTLSAEVAEVLWAPIDALASDALRASREVTVHGGKVRVPAYVIDERVVWGMTYHLLERFLASVLAFA